MTFGSEGPGPESLIGLGGITFDENSKDEKYIRSGVYADYPEDDERSRIDLVIDVYEVSESPEQVLEDMREELSPGWRLSGKEVLEYF